MPTFGPGSHTYTPDVDATVKLSGAGGGSSGGGEVNPGGAGGFVSIPVDAGTALTIEVGSAGGTPAAGTSPAGDGGAGGELSSGGQPSGGGGGATVVTRQSDGVELAAAGGGGGGGTTADSTIDQSSGGGGARGGTGGSVESGSGTIEGEDAAGTGVGGDGGDGRDFGADPGDPGGATTATSVSPITTTAAGGGSASDTDGEVVVELTDPNPPTNVSQSVTGDESIDVSWDGDDTAAEYDVEVAEDGGSFATVTTTTATSITYSATPGVNTHEFRVRAVNEKTSSAFVSTATVATDPSNLSASGFTFDAVDLSWDGARDATEYRILRARSDGSTVNDYAEVGRTSATQFDDADAPPSTQLHYRVQAVYPGANSALSNQDITRRKGLLAESINPSTVDLEWRGHNASPDGWRIEERRVYDGAVGEFREITVDDNQQYFAGTSPGTTTEYRVTALSSGPDDPGTATATTGSLGFDPRGVPATGWYVEIEHPDRDAVAEPTILSDVTATPRLNGKPEVTIPIPRAETWLDEQWERQPMRVWRDGERLPIEQLEDVRVARGDGGDRIELVGRGGVDLDKRFETEVSDRSAHNVMRDALDASGYPFTVDAAPSSGQSFGTLANDEAFRSNTDINELLDPVAINADSLEPRRSGIITPLPELESTGVDIISDATVNWTASNAVEFDVDEQRNSEWTFETEYRIPAEHVGIHFRASYNFDGYILVYLDDQKVASIARTSAGDSDRSVEWKDIIDLAGARTDNNIDDLDPGTHTLRVETTDTDPTVPQAPLGPAGELYIDMPAVVDEREWDPSTFANTLDGNERLDGPPGVYAPQTIDFRIRPIQRATGASLSATVSDTTNDQAIGVGPSATDVTEAANATSIDRDFSGSTGEFIARVVIGGADGDQANGPNDGVETYYTNYRTVPQSLNELAIEYDALGSPSITETINNPIAEVLTAKSDRANCVWEVQWDESAGEPRVVVTQVGQREGDADPDVGRYEVLKNIGREISGATIYGRSATVEGERFTASLSGTDLSNERLDPGSERVVSTGGTEFESAAEASGDGDYEMDYQDGGISITDSGGMTAGQDYIIDYQYTPAGTVERDVDFASHRIETLNAVRSDTAARSAASFLVDALDSPQWEAEITIPQREAGFNLVDTIAPDRLPEPAGGRYEIRTIDESAGELTLTLGARLSAGDVIRQLERELAETTRET